MSWKFLKHFGHRTIWICIFPVGTFYLRPTRIMAIHSSKKKTKNNSWGPCSSAIKSRLVLLELDAFAAFHFWIMDKSYQNSSTMSLPKWRLFALLLLFQLILPFQHLVSNFKFKDLAEDASRSKGTSALELPFGSALSRSNACTWLVSMLAFKLQKWLQMVAVMQNIVPMIPMNLLTLSLYCGTQPWRLLWFRLEGCWVVAGFGATYQS